jgi:hypothetical protein
MSLEKLKAKREGLRQSLRFASVQDDMILLLARIELVGRYIARAS